MESLACDWWVNLEWDRSDSERAAVETIKHPSARIVFSIEEMLICQVIVFLHWYDFAGQETATMAKIDGIAASANVTKDHGARIKNTQRKLLSMNM